MSHLLQLFRESTLIAGYSYFEYQTQVAGTALIPWLKRYCRFQDWDVLDIGCHHGGTLHALREEPGIRSGLGLEINPALLETTPFVADDRFRLECRDVQSEPPDGAFDLILFQDTLEHIPAYAEVLRKATSLLKPGGLVFVSFPPFYSPFGGHQAEATNWTKSVPFLHYLPTALFFRLIKSGSTNYMSPEDVMADIRSVHNTRLTLARFEQAVQDAGLCPVARDHFLIRPEFELRYGLSPVKSGIFGKIPLVREVLTLGVYVLLQDGRGM